jgi:hypothetical protein
MAFALLVLSTALPLYLLVLTPATPVLQPQKVNRFSRAATSGRRSCEQRFLTLVGSAAMQLRLKL